MKEKYQCNPKLIIKETGKYGKGVFAGEDIKKGSVIRVLKGRRMDITDIVNMVNSNKEHINDPFQIGRRTYLDLDEESRSFNHSCNPNTGVRKNSDVFAIIDIKCGDELTFDYSSIVGPTEWKMKCRCKSINCRKIIGDILSLPKKQLEYYKKVGALQRYMKSILNEVKSGTYKTPKYESRAINNLSKTYEL